MKAGSWIQKVNGKLKLFVFVLKLLFCTEKENQTMEEFFFNYHQALKTVNFFKDGYFFVYCLSILS